MSSLEIAGVLVDDDADLAVEAEPVTEDRRASKEAARTTGRRGTHARATDLRRRRVLTTLQGHSAEVRSSAVTPNGRRVISASDDRTLKIWDLETGGVFTTLAGHTGRVRSCAVPPDGQRVVSAPTADDLIVPLPPDAAERRRSRTGLEPFRGTNYSGLLWREPDLPALGWRHRRHNDMRVTFITLAIDDGADPEIIENRVTHARRSRSTFDGYNRGLHWERTGRIRFTPLQRL